MSESGATDPADLGLLEAAALMRTGTLSAVELLEACQARIGARNGGPPPFHGAPGALNPWRRPYPQPPPRPAPPAAALAARMVPAAVGTDTAGSVRIPAALSGVCSIKPTFGRVPDDGCIPLSPTLDHPGPMARNVADASALLAALATEPGVDPDPVVAALPLRPRSGPRPLDGLRVAVTGRPDAADP